MIQEQAQEEGYGGLPPSVLQLIMSFLPPAPSRLRASRVNKRWKKVRSPMSHKLSVAIRPHDLSQPK